MAMLPVLSAAARFLLANGRGEAVKKFGSKAIDVAKKELKKRDSTMGDMARTANRGANRGTTKGQKAEFEKRRQASREKRLESEQATGSQKSDAFNPPKVETPLNFNRGGMTKSPMKNSSGGSVRGGGKARKTNSCTMVTMKGS
jgi:hypothetical protein|tara:strand:- start:250 stop:681 length:432 start_codon:yes stop_codon:yes gene_type:complete